VVRLNCPGPAGANGTFAAEERRPDGTLALVARRVGWHLLELLVTPTGTYARIDDREIAQHNAAQTDGNAVALGSTWNLAGQAVYDHLLIEGGYQSPTSLVLHYADPGAPVSVWRAFGPSTNVLARTLFYDTLDESLGTMMTVADESGAWQTGLGVLSSLSAQNYALRLNTLAQTVDTGVRRSAGWHLFEIIVTDRGAFAKIDNQLLAQSNAGHTSAAGVRFDATWGLTGEALYDGLLVVGADSAAWPDQMYTPLAIHYQRYSNLVPPDDGLVFAPLYPALGYCAPGADPRTCGLHSNDLRSVMSSALAWQRYGQQTGETAAVALAKRAFLEGWLNAPWKRSADEPWRACLTGQEPCQDVDNWSRGAVMRMMVYAAYALWADLDDATQAAVALDLYAQAATYAARQPESGYAGDTKAEENGWHAAFLAAVVNLIPAPPGYDAAALEGRARCFAYHTITVAGDGPYCGVETQTVWDDWHVENHNQPSALYAAGALTFLGEGAISYRLAGRPIPYEFMHNVRPLFEAYQTHVDPDTYDHIGVPPDWAGAHDSAFSSPTVYRFMDLLGIPTGHSWPDYLTKRSLFYHDLASTWSKKAPDEVRVEVWNQIDQTEESYHFFLDSLDAGEFYAFATFSLTLPPYLPERLYLPALSRQP
jgi:hypothetical protein